MTFPAGKMPDYANLSNLGFAAPSRSKAFAGGGSDMDLTDPANSLTPCAAELVITATGNMVAQLATDAAPQTYPVTAGQVLRGAFVLLKGTSTASCLARQ